MTLNHTTGDDESTLAAETWPRLTCKKLLRAAIGVMLVGLCLASWWLFNRFLARRLRLVDIVQIGDSEAAAFVGRWDRNQLDLPQTLTLVKAVYHLRPDLESTITLPMPVDLGHEGVNGRELPRRFSGTYTLSTYTITPLQLAVRRGDRAMVKTLLAAGAQPGLVDDDGLAPIHEATGHGYVKIAEYLLDAQVSVNLPSLRDGESPLHHAVANGQIKMTEFLISHGADVDQADNQGRVPLHKCAHFLGCHAEITRILLDAGANPDIPDRKGFTPLHLAAESACPEVLTILIREGVNVNAYSQYAGTPLDQTAKIIIDGKEMTERRQSCIAILIEHGAKYWIDLPAATEFVGRVEIYGDVGIWLIGDHPKPFLQLWGLLFPENGHPHRTVARKAIELKILGEDIKVIRDHRMQNFANAYIGDRWINRELVSEGHAYYCPLAFEGSKELWEAQVYARKNGLGLWAFNDDPPAWLEGYYEDFK